MQQRGGQGSVTLGGIFEPKPMHKVGATDLKRHRTVDDEATDWISVLAVTRSEC